MQCQDTPAPALRLREQDHVTPCISCSDRPDGLGQQFAQCLLPRSIRRHQCACIEATGSIELTSTLPFTSHRFTLQGKMAPTRGAMPMAS